MKKQTVPNQFLLLTGILFFAIWTLYDILIYPATLQWFPELTCVLIKNLFKILLWVLAPCLFLKKKYDTAVYVPLETLFAQKIQWRGVLLTALCFLLYTLTSALISFGSLKTGNNFTLPVFLNSVVFVGITEEMMFRGWFLNAFLEKMTKWKSILLSSLLFLLIHFPSWMMKGQLFTLGFPLSALSVLLLSIIFSFSFIKNRNLIAPILLHMFWNFLQILFF